MAALQVEIVETPQGIITRLTGEPGILDCRTLETSLLGLMARRPTLVVFDLAGLASVPSLVMGILVSFRKSVGRNGGKVKLAALQPLVLESFKIARLHELFEITATVDEALGTHVA